jgi:hypothetical protein
MQIKYLEFMKTSLETSKKLGLDPWKWENIQNILIDA